MLKIAVIGGGSSYTPEIVQGFIDRYDSLPIDELWLLDIEAGREKLEIVGGLAQRMMDKAGLACKVVLTLDRQAALRDANFVTTQFRVGLLEARIKDERLPLSKGMLGQETNGVAGFAKALRTIPVILDICKDMETLCPQAFLINFTNPAGIITEVVQRFTKIKAIGLCNVPVNMRKAVAKVLDTDDFLFHAIGLNHYVYGYGAYHQGTNKMETILPSLLEDSEFNPKNIEDVPYINQQILATGLMPCYYHKYYYMSHEMVAHALEDYKTKGTRAETVKQVEEELFRLYQDPDLKEKPKVLEKRGGAYYSDAACELINAIYNNLNSHMVVNVKNNNILPFLPPDAVIETTCIINNSGAIPLSIGPLPEVIQGELHLLKAYERLTIEAAMEGSYQKALHALTIHPLTQSGKVIQEILDQILVDNKPYLPQFSS